MKKRVKPFPQQQMVRALVEILIEESLGPTAALISPQLFAKVSESLMDSIILMPQHVRWATNAMLFVLDYSSLLFLGKCFHKCERRRQKTQLVSWNKYAPKGVKDFILFFTKLSMFHLLSYSEDLENSVQLR